VLARGGDLAAVPSLLYRKAGVVQRTGAAPANMLLDDLPLPAWDLLPGFPAAYSPAIYDFPRGPVGTIAASRGCPFHCRFCDTSTFGAKVRHYSPESVFAMMQHLQGTYGVRHIQFVDDLFLASRDRVNALCKLIIDSGLKITWTCSARVDTVKPDILAIMKQAGCWEIEFGLETGSDTLLRRMDKMASVDKNAQALAWTAAAGIRTKGLFMLGYPGETRDTIEETRRFICSVPMGIMNLTKFTPYPGSPVYRDLYGTNIREDHWEKMNGMNFVWAPEGFTTEELDRAYQELLMSFYRRRAMLLYYAGMTLRHPNHLWRLLRGGLGFVIAKLRSRLSGRRGVLIGRREHHLDRVPASSPLSR
jgi:anaerobic magnesium-protoporphyrin IX monomethyl ester cyclase